METGILNYFADEQLEHIKDKLTAKGDIDTLKYVFENHIQLVSQKTVNSEVSYC